MTDILLDTNVLGDLLAFYYNEEYRRTREFRPYRTLTLDRVRRLNHVLHWHSEDEWDDSTESAAGLVVASTFAFVEISRQFDRISRDRFSIDQFRAFLNQPPPWFLISALDETVLPMLLSLPTQVSLANGKDKPLELADALHIATALSRDDCLIAVTDGTLKAISFISNRLV